MTMSMSYTLLWFNLNVRANVVALGRFSIYLDVPRLKFLNKKSRRSSKTVSPVSIRAKTEKPKLA